MSVSLVLYLLVLVPYTLFVVLYATRSPWYRSAMGRSLLLSKSVIAALAWNAVLALWLGDYTGRGVIRVFIVGGAIVAGWAQLILLVIEQRKPDDGQPRRRATDRKEKV